MNTGPAQIVVSVHDVAPATASASHQWVRDLDERGVRASLLVVPGPWRGHSLALDRDLVHWLQVCVDRGHEICLHGWNHTAAPGGSRSRRAVGRLLARGCAEFWTLDEAEAQRRVQRGLEELARAGLSTTGFTPPGWLASPEAVRGVQRAGLHYITSHRSVTDLRHQRSLPAWVICHRPGGLGEGLGAALMSGGPRRLLRPGRTLRLALHPDDLGRPGLREAALRGIDTAIEGGAIALTYAELIDSSNELRTRVVESRRVATFDQEWARLEWQCL